MNVNTLAPGPIWTALTPNQRTAASEYESKLARLQPAQLMAEYEAVTYEFYAAQVSLAWLQVVECRREIVRRMGTGEQSITPEKSE